VGGGGQGRKKICMKLYMRKKGAEDSAFSQNSEPSVFNRQRGEEGGRQGGRKRGREREWRGEGPAHEPHFPVRDPNKTRPVTVHGPQKGRSGRLSKRVFSPRTRSVLGLVG
jgi:hypothetical protein